MMSHYIILERRFAKAYAQLAAQGFQLHWQSIPQSSRGERRNQVAQFLAVCRRSKWSKHFTNAPLLALLAMAGSSAARKISSACSQELKEADIPRQVVLAEATEHA
jgi:hypothetical protein